MIFKGLTLAALFYGITMAGTDLTGRIWSVGELNKSSEDLSGYRIEFISNDSAQCRMECNTAFFLYAADGQSLSFTFKGQTIRYCPDTRDEECIAAIVKCNRMVTAENRIYLLNGSDTLISLFDSQKSPLFNITWRLVELNHSTRNIPGYSIHFYDDSVTHCNMHCNGSIFRYSVRGDSIGFTFWTVSLMVCSPDTRENEFMKTLEKVKRKAVVGHDIYLLDETDTLMTLTGIPASPLCGVTWILEELNHSAENIAEYWLKFIGDTTATAHMHCNTCSFRYSIPSDAVDFAPGMCTMVACMTPNREGQFESAMRQVTRWRRSGMRLLLLNATDTLMSYIDSAASLLTKQTWRLRCIGQPSGRTLIDNPENYTATFGVDGSLRVVADCNTCSGTCNVGGDYRLNIPPLACTKMYCGPASHDTAYIFALQRSTTFMVDSDTLLCLSYTDTLCFTGTTTTIAPATFPGVTVDANKIRIQWAGPSLLIESRNIPIAGVRLYNARGVCVRASDRMTGNKAVIGTAGLPAGIYMVRVSTHAGTQITRAMYLCEK